MSNIALSLPPLPTRFSHGRCLALLFLQIVACSVYMGGDCRRNCWSSHHANRLRRLVATTIVLCMHYVAALALHWFFFSLRTVPVVVYCPLQACGLPQVRGPEHSTAHRSSWIAGSLHLHLADCSPKLWCTFSALLHIGTVCSVLHLSAYRTIA